MIDRCWHSLMVSQPGIMIHLMLMNVWSCQNRSFGSLIHDEWGSNVLCFSKKVRFCVVFCVLIQSNYWGIFIVGCESDQCANDMTRFKCFLWQLLCRTSHVARLLSSKNYSRRDHIGIYVGIQEILSSKSNTSSSINRSEHPAAGRRVQSTPTSSFKSGYK